MRRRRQWVVRARTAKSARRMIVIGYVFGAVAALAAPLGASSATTPSLRSDQQAPTGIVRAQSNVALGDGRLRTAVERLGSGRSLPAGVEARGDKVLVEILLSGTAKDG